jgi:D-alanyl-D-alanine carboxypeptidase
MLKTSSIFVFTMVLSCVSVGAELGASIERALRPLGQWRSKTTIYVAETPTKILFQNQGSKDLIPASVTKILTAGAVFLRRCGF